MRGVIISCLVIAVSSIGATARADGIALGAKLPALTFTDIRYLPRTLDDFGAKKAYVVVFTTTGCPLVERYLPVLQRLETAYRGKDVQFLALNVGLHDSIVSMAAHAVEHEVELGG
jgi:thiol-disulfide isomerase/thioredoxin